ncbi:MAG: hypothetical protein IH616_04195 [Gemmatimonadales bacterium]|jgi:hypothetical protein|nr:hypothetical protein [Gemmatimonadales bacterium]
MTITAVMLMTASAVTGAQTPAGAPAQELPGYESTLLALRDSVDRVRAELTRFQRDLQLAGAQTVVARARRVSSACEGLHRAMTESAPALQVSASANQGLARASQSLQSQMRETSRALTRECKSGLGPEGPGSWADSLKAWGPHRTSQLEQSLNAYERVVAGFTRAAGIELKPRLP